MKRKKFFILIVFLFIFISTGNVYAYEISDSTLTEYIKIDTLYSYISDDIVNFLESEEIDIKDISSLQKLDIGSFLEYIYYIIKNKVNIPFKAFISSIILILLSSLATSFSSQIIDKNNSQIFETVCALISIIMITDVLYESFLSICNMIQYVSEFITAFIPIFSGILLMSTGEATASGYNISLFYICSVIIKITDDFFIPIFSMLFCLSIADSMNTVISFNSIINCFTKIITSGSKVILSIFISVLSFQTILNNTTDKIGHKALKTVISSSIPVVGSTISEAYGTIQSSIMIFKNYVGLFGIIIVCLILLPVFIEIITYKLMIVILKNIAEMFNAKIFEKFLKHYESLTSIAIALLTCVVVMFSITIALSIVFSQTNF
jgi:stage III sporulation protein AE